MSSSTLLLESDSPRAAWELEESRRVNRLLKPKLSIYITGIVLIAILLLVSLALILVLWLRMEKLGDDINNTRGDTGDIGPTGLAGPTGASSGDSSSPAFQVATNALVIDETFAGISRFTITLSSTAVTLPSFDDGTFFAARPFEFCILPSASADLSAPFGTSIFGPTSLPPGSLALVASNSVSGWHVNL